ncbi:SAM-dependent methyltransferase [Candidatus Methylacidiphilum fumarolicum]|nr:SAM-dependent methyltransferase [Candidatus Methylacidiphilum fumarolicum]TFE75564.1 SAM-dependent methyltransferase [Candidatus Methylacidiphilum fumarolicum]
MLSTPFYWRGLFLKVAAGIEHETLLKNIPSCEIIVDIGANRGQFSLVARRYFPNALIYAFEPQPNPAKVYKALFKDDPKVIFFTGGIGPVAGKFPMHVSLRDDSSSLLPISWLQDNFFPGTAKKEEILVEIGPLDYWLKNVDLQSPALLKIDVQGYELEVLRGCENLLESFQYIYVEASFYELYIGQALADQILYFLYSKHFRFRGIYNLVYNSKGNSIQGDFFFERKK